MVEDSGIRETDEPSHWSFQGRSVFSFTADEAQGPASTKGAGQVVLIHELPGLSPNCIALGARLAHRGFSVHMPLLYGEYGQYNAGAGLRQMWCLRAEFEMFRAGRTSRIVDWLRPLTAHVSTGAGSVGIIGMCATGGFVLAMMSHPAVGAAVAAQPAMPFRFFWTRRSRSAIGTAAADLANSAASDTSLMVTRFENDPVCPSNRVGAIADVFDEPRRDFRYREFPGRRHATLTEHAAFAEGLFGELVEFLSGHLTEDPTQTA